MRQPPAMVTALADPARVSEAAFQRMVVHFAQLRGWKVHHTRPAQNSRGDWRTPIQGDKGFPDLVLARDGKLILLELKSEKGRLSPEQVEWLDALGVDDSLRFRGAEMTVAVVRPSGWQRLANLLQ